MDKSVWVIKVGGSLMNAPALKHWLDIFVQFSNGRVVIVPGGGIFADAVRIAQLQTGISDAMAHQLAIKAMDQYGLLLTDINPNLAIASSELELAERSWQHRAIIWLPSHMALIDNQIPENWDMTSDSLAAWLANKLGAEQLILLKFKKPKKTNLNQLRKEKFIDGYFAKFIQNQVFSTWILSKDDYPCFEEGLSFEKLNQIAIKLETSNEIF